MAREDWCLIESDPAIFTEMIKGFGATGLEVQEVYSLADLNDREFGKVHGLIFLFALFPDVDKKTAAPDTNVDVYFSMQIVTNACASQALINLLMNCDSAEFDLGPTLTEFKSFTANMDPSTRGLCLTNSEKIRTVHNSFGCPLLLELESPENGAHQKPYHFITYVPKGGHVFELDGLMPKPVDLGVVPPDGNWLDLVRSHIQTKIDKYNAEEICFNLMAVVPDKKLALQRKLEELIKQNNEAEVAKVKESIEWEDKKRAHYQAEVNRYRHNYVPFIVELLSVLAKEGKLSKLISEHSKSAASTNSKQ